MYCLYTIVALVLCAVSEIQGHPFHAPPPGVVHMNADVFNTPRFPQRCVAPSKFEGYASEFRIPGYTSIITKFSYDADGKRVRAAYSVAGASPPIIHDVLVLYETGVSYDRDVVAGTCTKGTVHKDFPTKEVPQNATFAGRVFVGTSFLLDQWVYNTPIPNPSTVSATWAADGSCLPINESHLLGKSSALTSVFNVTLGIKDPAVWNLPQGCKQGTLAGTGPSLTTFFPIN